MRHDLPGIGEQVFGIHHPNGAVKKLSPPVAEGFSTVKAQQRHRASPCPKSLHVSGGSSGSGLFDMAGRILGVLSNGDPCCNFSCSDLLYFPTKTILAAIVPAPPPPITRDVMVVFDRSGSMSEDDGTGRPKIEAARDAAALFYQLIKAGGNRAGLVSFDTESSLSDQGRASVTAALKNDADRSAALHHGQGWRPDPGQQNVDRRRSEFGKERAQSGRRESHGRSC